MIKITPQGIEDNVPVIADEKHLAEALKVYPNYRDSIKFIKFNNATTILFNGTPIMLVEPVLTQ